MDNKMLRLTNLIYPKNICQQPCDPDENCFECSEYWERMEAMGLWDGINHRWTDKGMDEIKHRS